MITEFLKNIWSLGKMNCEYVKEYYGVPAAIGLRILYKGKKGIIAEDRGHYIGANFDADKPGVISNIHPTDENLEYLKSFGKIRKLTRSQQRYQDYIDSEYDESFAEWMGFIK